MIKLIIRKMIKNYDSVNDVSVREAYGVLAGTIGIICNLLLFATKLSVGLIISSIAVVSDAFNNMTDMAASLISILGSKFSNKPADQDHPMGHGRYEYIAALMVSFIIMTVGLQLLKSSYEKLVNPEIVHLNIVSMVLLILSVLVKLWMYSYNIYIGKKINSGINRATAIDSLNDSIATTLVIISMLIGHYFNIPIDGVAGIGISLLILYSGFTIARDTVNLLLGKAPDPETEDKIYELVVSGEKITGAHDLIVHDYGPGRIVASIHAEVPEDLKIQEIHSTIDQLEKKIWTEMGIDLVIHMDPISIDNIKVETIEEEIKNCISKEMGIDILNFRIVRLLERTNILFDIRTEKKMTREEINLIQKQLQGRIDGEKENYDVFIKEVITEKRFRNL